MNFGCSGWGRRSIVLLGVVSLLPFGGSIRQAGAEPQRMPTNDQDQEQVTRPSSGKKISLQFQGMDVLEVLKILAEEAGLNLVAGRNVAGRVTLFLREVDPWEALEVILKSNDLAYERQGQILSIVSRQEYELLYGVPFKDRRILSSVVLRYAKAAEAGRALVQIKSNVGRVIADETTNTLIFMDLPDLVEEMRKLVAQMDQPLQTRVFSLSYGSVKVLGPILQEAVTKNLGKLLVDERTNRIVVTDYPDKIGEIAKMVEAFDDRSSEVLIDAKIVQITLSNKFQLGIDWEALARENITLKAPNALNLTSGGSVKVAQAALNAAGDYKALIEALRTFGTTQILSEPRITVVNNQEAKILVGSKEPYVTTQISQTGTGTAVTAESVNFIDVGVKLFVTPSIARDGFVQMKIRPEISSRTGTLTTAQKNEIPIVETTEAETVVMVEDGNVVILGGLIKDEVSRDEQRVPILGDIPILGIPFRSTKKTVKRTELVLFLTPHIITGGAPRPEEAAEKSAQEGGWDYEEQLSHRIQKVVEIQRLLEKPKGQVIIEFTLNPDGRIWGVPKVVSADPEDLGHLARQAVLAASPFVPFPPGLGNKARTFKVSLDYE